MTAVAIVGAGPRGLSVLERLIAHLEPGPGVVVHLIDPYEPGGRVWRTDQSRHLLMNTSAGDATLYLDESVEAAGPRFAGPTLFEWAQDVDSHLPAGSVDEHLRVEIAELTPLTSVSRRLYGTYLGWVYSELVKRVPEGSTVTHHRAEAVSIRPEQDEEVVQLDDGRSLRVACAVLALGHTDTVDEDSRSAGHLPHVYIAPGQPSEQPWHMIPAGEAVIVRGLGLNFFDTMAELTLGRGGRFEPGPDGALQYHASGHEPVLWAGSRRGVPFKAKPVLAERPAPLMRRYPGDRDLERLQKARGLLDLDRDIWPWIAKEARWQAARAELAETTPALEGALAAAFDRAPGAAVPDAGMIRREFGLTYRFDPDHSGSPLEGRRFVDYEHLQAAVLEWILDDLGEAGAGYRSAVKTGDRAVGAARSWLFPLAAYGGLLGPSHRSRLEGWFAGHANALAGGPPAIRLKQLTALMRAGVVRMLGAGMRTTADDEGVEATSLSVPDRSVRGRALVEARLPETDLERTSSRLLETLRDEGRVRAYQLPTIDPQPAVRTGGFDVTSSPFRVVDAHGVAERRLLAIGIPVGPHVGTSFTAVGRSNSEFLRQTDAVARAALDLALAAPRDARGGAEPFLGMAR